MIDGFLLFAILDVWRMILPLGLSLILFSTLLIEWKKSRITDNGGLGYPLCAITHRCTWCLLVIMGLVGIVVPWALAYSLPEAHIAEGPWSFEEIFGYVVGSVLLGSCYKLACRNPHVSSLGIGCAAGVFLGVGVVWIARWDMMAHEGNVPGGWLMAASVSWEWARVFPKVVHLVFSSLVVGGIVITGLGLYRWVGWQIQQGMRTLSSEADFPRIIRYGVGWILFGLVPQVLIGPWLFVALGEGARNQLIDGTYLISPIFFISLTTALLALVLLNASFMVPHARGLVWSGLISALITLVLMGMVRYLLFVATIHVQGMPLSTEVVTLLHLGIGMLLSVLVGAILIRWCVMPLPQSLRIPT